MILVTGATGNVGSEAVRLLAARAEPVRALVRSRDRAPGGAVEIAVGDFDSPSSLRQALHGVDTVVLVSPAVPAQEIAVIDAAVDAGVGHVVKISSKASDDSPVERRRGQARIEAHLLASGIGHTLLRPNGYQQNLLALAPSVRATQGFIMSAGDGQVGMTDARDVAAVAVEVARAPAAHAGRTYWPTGPGLVTYGDIADTLTELLGHPVEYRRVTPDEHRDAMLAAGLPRPVAESNAQAFALIAEGDAAWITDDVHTVTGRAPRTVRDFSPSTSRRSADCYVSVQSSCRDGGAGSDPWAITWSWI